VLHSKGGRLRGDHQEDQLKVRHWLRLLREGGRRAEEDLRQQLQDRRLLRRLPHCRIRTRSPTQQTRLKSKAVIDEFFEHPVKAIEGTDKLAEICAFPYKKCALLFSDSSKFDRTAYDYLKEVAKNFINEYQFFEVDLSCNPHFKEEIQHLKKTTSGLAVYHPTKQSYVYLKAKLSKSTFERFLKANLADDKKLPFRKWNQLNIQVHACKGQQPEKERTPEE
jgi:hypothetical protein